MWPKLTLVGLAVADPVDQVAVTIVEGARLRLDGAAGVAQSALDGAQFLWLQVAVRLMSPDGVVELREGRHSERGVEVGERLPVAVQPQAHVDAGIDSPVHVGLRVLRRRQSCRDEERSEGDVVFQEKLEIGAVEAVGVEALRPVDGVLPVERVAQVGAEDVLVAHLCSEGRAPQRPVEVGVEVEAEDLRAMVVVGHFRLRPAYQFEAILLVVPVDGWTEVELSASVLTLQRQEGLEGVLKLVVEARAIVSVRPVVLAA